MKQLVHSFNAKTFVFFFALLFAAFASKAQILTPGNSMFSPDGKYKLTLESNGNLVLYNNNTQVWQSNTAGQGVTKLNYTFHNVQLTTSSGQSKWESNGVVMTSNINSGIYVNEGAILKLQNDGNLVIDNNAGVNIWYLRDRNGVYLSHGESNIAGGSGQVEP